jgi:hypothetical protein
MNIYSNILIKHSSISNIYDAELNENDSGQEILNKKLYAFQDEMSAADYAAIDNIMQNTAEITEVNEKEFYMKPKHDQTTVIDSSINRRRLLRNEEVVVSFIEDPVTISFNEEDNLENNEEFLTHRNLYTREFPKSPFATSQLAGAHHDESDRQLSLSQSDVERSNDSKSLGRSLPRGNSPSHPDHFSLIGTNWQHAMTRIPLFASSKSWSFK